VLQPGAAETEPFPVWLKNFFVVVVLPLNLDSVFEADEYNKSPNTYVL
jgi:hypothetical protein